MKYKFRRFKAIKLEDSTKRMSINRGPDMTKDLVLHHFNIKKSKRREETRKEDWEE